MEMKNRIRRHPDQGSHRPAAGAILRQYRFFGHRSLCVRVTGRRPNRIAAATVATVTRQSERPAHMGTRSTSSAIFNDIFKDQRSPIIYPRVIQAAARRHSKARDDARYETADNQFQDPSTTGCRSGKKKAPVALVIEADRQRTSSIGHLVLIRVYTRAVERLC